MTALSDLRVLDLSQDVAGPFCTKLLADFGADVIKVEPPGQGDRARSLGPFPDAEPNPEASGVFLYLNTNKRSITLDIDTPTGRHLLRELAATADIVVESFDVGVMASMALDFDQLETLRPGIILTSITPFGQTGPWRHYQATDLITHATSGLSAVNRVQEGPPLRQPGYQTAYQGGAFAFLSTMAAVCYRDVERMGQHVDIAIQEAAATMIAPEIARVSYAGRSPGMRLGFLPCKDGYITLNVRSDQSWRELWTFFGHPEGAEDKRFLTVGDRRKNQAEMEAYLKPYLQTYTMAELFDALQPRRILVGMALDIPHLLGNPHLKAREFFVDVDHPVAGPITFPGAPFKMRATPWQLCRPAPLLGQHNDEVYIDFLGHTREDLDRWRTEGVI
jgi:crotonobetainyl-CoA:carnitine CoA-transferase CaiB-like acyl-CoA transferase